MPSSARQIYRNSSRILNNRAFLRIDRKITKKVIKKDKFITGLSAFGLIISIIASLFLIYQVLDIERHFGLTVFVMFVVEASLVFGYAYIVTSYIPKKFFPKHLWFVQVLMNYRYDQLEAGMFNGKLMINSKNNNTWETQAFESWIDSDYMLYKEDGFDSGKITHVLVDLTKGKTEVHISNVKDEGMISDVKV